MLLYIFNDILVYGFIQQTLNTFLIQIICFLLHSEGTYTLKQSLQYWSLHEHLSLLLKRYSGKLI